jgi:hypothetical protein
MKKTCTQKSRVRLLLKECGSIRSFQSGSAWLNRKSSTYFLI